MRYELATGHSYNGKLAPFSEIVLFKRLIKYKASDVCLNGEFGLGKALLE